MTEPPTPDFARCARRNSERLAIVEYVLKSSLAEESDYLEWKSGYDLSARPGAASTAKQLIGMANRDLAQAGRHAEGYAYVLLGVEHGKLQGVPHWDSADIENWLSRFVETELRYDEHYVELDGKEVLLFTVDPPREGDPMFCLQNSSDDPITKKSLPEGTIYVRHGGKTEPASAQDIKRLAARATPSGAALALDVALDPTGLRVIPPQALTDEYMRSKLDAWTKSMMRQVPEQTSALSYAQIMEKRSPTQYSEELKTYLGMAEELWLILMAYEVIKAGHSKLKTTLINDSDENYENTVVEITLALGRPNVHLNAHEARTTLKLPERPVPWGQMLASKIHETTPVISTTIVPRPEIQEVGDRLVRVRFPELRARPHSSHNLADLVLALPPEYADQTVSVDWRATASNTKGDLSGKTEFLVPGKPASEDHETSAGDE